MSGTYPTSPAFMGVSFRAVDYNVRSDSITGRTQVRSLAGHRFEFTARYNNMNYSDFQPIRAFIASQRGDLETFTIVLPVICENQGTASGSVTVSGAHSVGATSVTVTGLSNTLKAGNLLVFSNHSKAYMVTADRTGSGAVSITPPLIEALAGAESVTYDDVPLTVRLSNGIQEFPLSLPAIANFEVDMVEAI